MAIKWEIPRSKYFVLGHRVLLIKETSPRFRKVLLEQVALCKFKIMVVLMRWNIFAGVSRLDLLTFIFWLPFTTTTTT